MDFTTYETSKRLFEIGFQQPEKKRGQVWFRNRKDKENYPLVFAPTAEDILPLFSIFFIGASVI